MWPSCRRIPCTPSAEARGLGSQEEPTGKGGYLLILELSMSTKSRELQPLSLKRKLTFSRLTIATSVFLCRAPSRLSCGPRQLWRTKAWPARGLRTCFGGRKFCVLFIVLWWDPGGRRGLWGSFPCGTVFIFQLVGCPGSEGRGQSVAGTLKLGTR